MGAAARPLVRPQLQDGVEIAVAVDIPDVDRRDLGGVSLDDDPVTFRAIEVGDGVVADAVDPVVMHVVVLAGNTHPVDRPVVVDVLVDDVELGVDQRLEAELVGAGAARQRVVGRQVRLARVEPAADCVDFAVGIVGGVEILCDLGLAGIRPADDDVIAVTPRNLVLAILTGIIGDSKMGQFLKSKKEQMYYSIFSRMFNKLLAEKTVKETNFSDKDQVFNEIQRFSEEEGQCYNFFMNRKRLSQSVGYSVLRETDMKTLYEGCDNDTIVSVARAIADALAEESSVLSLVVYYDDGGLPGLIIGSAPLADGLNELVAVEVVDSAVTEQLHLQIHDDVEPIGEFNFPGTDNPRLYHGRLPATTTFLTNSGDYLQVQDQELIAAAVTMPLIVLEEPAWLVIRSGSEPEVGTILGRTWLPAGINRSIAVELALDPELTYTALAAILHTDAEELEQFEYPNGDDQPLEYNGRIIYAPFNLLTVAE